MLHLSELPRERFPSDVVRIEITALTIIAAGIIEEMESVIIILLRIGYSINESYILGNTSIKRKLFQQYAHPHNVKFIYST